LVKLLREPFLQLQYNSNYVLLLCCCTAVLPYARAIAGFSSQSAG
jgi:hypothetical protein